jgi:hypothetical protein
LRTSSRVSGLVSEGESLCMSLRFSPVGDRSVARTSLDQRFWGFSCLQRTQSILWFPLLQ